MSKSSKNEKNTIDTLTYLKRVKGLGIFGIIFSIVLFGYDIYMFKGTLSIISLVVDGVLLLFSIYFIVKSCNLKKRELIAIERDNKKVNNKKSKK